MHHHGYRIYNGRGSFIAKFSKDERPVWINKLDMGATGSGQQAVITSISVDPTGELGGSSVHYVAGYYSDGLPGTAQTTAGSMVMSIYNVDLTTRVAAATSTTTLSTLNVDAYGQIGAQVAEGRMYQEGFLIKYSGAGQYMASEVIKGTSAKQQLAVSNLIVRVFHPATSSMINTQTPKDGPTPSVPSTASRTDVDYDRGMAVSATQGGGTQSTSTIVLATSAATYFRALARASPPRAPRATSGTTASRSPSRAARAWGRLGPLWTTLRAPGRPTFSSTGTAPAAR